MIPGLNTGVLGGDSFHVLKLIGLKRIISVLPFTSVSAIGAVWYIYLSQILEVNTFIIRDIYKYQRLAVTFVCISD